MSWTDTCGVCGKHRADCGCEYWDDVDGKYSGKKKTQKDFIEKLFLKEPAPELTCQEVTKLVATEFKKDSKYLSGSVSSTLKKLCNDGALFVMHNKTGPRGGMVYKRRII